MKNATHITRTGRIFKITSNKSQRTFTIVTDSGSKYKTDKFDKYEFNEALTLWSGNDWQQFLNGCLYSKIN